MADKTFPGGINVGEGAQSVALLGSSTGLNFTKPLDLSNLAAGSPNSALLLGGGNSSVPLGDGAVANKNFIEFRTKSTATSGDTRLAYLRQAFAAAGSGEVLRAFATVAGTNVATGGTVNGAHISLSVDAGATVSGQARAARLTLGAAAATRTLDGNLAVLNLDSDIGANNTVPATVAFIHVTDTGSVKIGHLLRLPAPSNSTIYATHTTQAMTHSIRIVADDGTPYYIMCTDAATNRGGGS